MISGELLYLQTINADWNVKLIVSAGVPTKVLIRFFLLMGGFSLRTSTSTDPLDFGSNKRSLRCGVGWLASDSGPKFEF